MNRKSASFPPHPKLARGRTGRFISLGFKSTGSAFFLAALVVGMLGVILAGSISWQSHAGGIYVKQKIFAHKSIYIKTGVGAKVIDASTGHYYSPGRLDTSIKSPGPKVINVARVLQARKSARQHKKGFKLTIRPNSPAISGPAAEHLRLLSRDGYGLAVPDIADMNCQAEYDCTIRMGNSASSPKIIILGQKRSVPGRDSAGNTELKIIHPPS